MRTTIIATILLAFSIGAALAAGPEVSVSIPRGADAAARIVGFSRDVELSERIGVNVGLSGGDLGGFGLRDEDHRPLHDEALARLRASLLGEVMLFGEVPLGRSFLRPELGANVFYSFRPEVAAGNMDRYIASEEGYDAVTTDFDLRPGLGYSAKAGVALVVPLARELARVSVGLAFFYGWFDTDLSGSYFAGVEGETVREYEEIPAELADASVDFSGFEISVGLGINRGRRR